MSGAYGPAAERDFRWLWGAHGVSIAGSLITRAGLPFVAVLALGATAAQMAWLQSARLVTSGAAGLVVGPWVDARRKRPLMVAADVARALILASVPIAAATGRLTFHWLVVVAVAAGMFDVLFDVARAAFLPALLGERALLAANSKLSATSAVAEVPSFGLTGWLVQWLGGPRAMAIDAGSFVVSALCLLRLRVPEPDPRASAAGHTLAGPRERLASAAAGMRLVTHDPLQRALAVGEGLLNFAIGVFMTTFTLYCTRTLGFTPGLLGMIFAVGGISSFAGAALAPRIEQRFGVGRAMTLGLVLGGVGMALLPIAHGANLASGALLIGHQLIGDGGWTLFILAAGTTRIARAPAAARGRIGAFVQTSNMFATLAGVVLSGWIAQQWNIRLAIAVGPAALVAGAIALARSPAGRVMEAAGAGRDR